MLVAVPLFAADPREAVIGRWHGTSICTPLLPACHDEVVVYHIAPAKKADVVTVTAYKVVNGEQLEMGDIDFTVDAAKREMVGEFRNSRTATRWIFTWNGPKMTGQALELPSKKVARNVSLSR